MPRRFDEGAIFADFNNDGALDFVTVHPDLGPLLFYRENGRFVPKNDIFRDEGLTYSKAYGVQAVDANSDGFLDMWINGASGGSPARLFINDRGQEFTRAELGYENILAAFSPGVAAPAVGDFNGDGAVDILQRSAGSRDTIVALSDAGPLHGAILLEVLGARGEHDQFGRVVRIADRDVPELVQTRIVDGGSGYMSQSSYSIAVPLQSSSVKSVSVSPFFFGDDGYSFELSSGFGAQIFAATPTSSARVLIYAAYPSQLDASPREIRGAHGHDELSGSGLADQLWGGAATMHCGARMATTRFTERRGRTSCKAARGATVWKAAKAATFCSAATAIENLIADPA